MAIKISDYIMEQEISNASVADIELARCFAEMEVISALIDCYAKQEIIAEYSSTDISEFGIFQEADGAPLALGMNDEESGKKRDNIFAKGWAAIVNLFKQIGMAIVRLFSKVKYADLIKKVEESDTEYYTFSKSVHGISSCINELLVVYNEFGELLQNEEINPSKYEAISKKVESISNKVKANLTNEGDNVKYTKDKVISILKNMEECQKNEIPKVKEILKQFNVTKKDFKPVFRDTLFPVIKKTASNLHSTFVTSEKHLLDMTTKIIKPQTSKNYKEYYAYGDSDYVQEMTSGGKKLTGTIVGMLCGGIVVGGVVGYFVGKHIARKQVGNEICERINNVRMTLGLNENDKKAAVNMMNKVLKELSKELKFAIKDGKQYTADEKNKLTELLTCTENLISGINDDDDDLATKLEKFVESANSVYKFCSVK